MKEVKPLSPTEVKTLHEDAVEFINNAFKKKEWHDQIFPVEGYHAIIETPYQHFKSVMPMVVQEFKEAGWDCYYAFAYDARGPHNCFYVHKKHFPE